MLVMKRIIALSILLMGLFVSCTSSNKTTVRQPVDVVKGKLTLHPVFTDIQTKEEQYFFFLDGVSRTLFMTTDTIVFETIVDYLPVRTIQSRSVLLEGTAIDPFTLFTKDQFTEFGSKVARLGVELNKWRVARIFNYGLIDSSGENSPPNKGTEKPGKGWRPSSNDSQLKKWRDGI